MHCALTWLVSVAPPRRPSPQDFYPDSLDSSAQFSNPSRLFAVCFVLLLLVERRVGRPKSRRAVEGLVFCFWKFQERLFL